VTLGFPSVTGMAQAGQGMDPADAAGAPPSGGGGVGVSDVAEYEPALIEEAVLAALRGHQAERAFHRERDRLYEVKDAEAREEGFRELHTRWFERLCLGRGIQQALAEQPSIAAATQGCRVARARSRHEEGAELFVRPAGVVPGEPVRRWVVIRLRATALCAADRALQFFRHELFHIADMLDPRFGYERHLPPAPAGPAHEALQRDRYRILWDTLIDGRLVHLGLAPNSLRAERLRDFVRTFPMLGPALEEAFVRLFDGAACTHADLVAFATHPAEAAAGAQGTPPSGSDLASPMAPGPHPGERCSICGFPTYAFVPDPLALPREVQATIQKDFPAWDPGQGLCLQCADLYRSRQ
jgi:hypothetical protein